MNTNDVLLRWSHMSLDQIEEEIRSGKDSDAVECLLGADTVSQLQEVSFAAPGMGEREAVVLLPGIMGSLLTSIRGTTSLVWINPLVFLNGKAGYLQLDKTGANDSCPEVEMVPVGLEKLTYLKISLMISHEHDFFEFPYDWRRPVVYNAAVLRDSVKRWYAGTGRKLTLLAHSMGGLVARAFMASFPEDAEKMIKQLIMLGTPNFGATNAIQTLFTGNSVMEKVNGLNKSNDMVNVARTLPGVYNLLPAPPEFFPTGKTYPASWDLYDASAWQVPGIQKNHLDCTRDLHKLLAKSDPQVPLVQVAGCNLETMVSIQADFAHLDKLGLPTLKPTQVAEGDGTVPLWSSCLASARLFFVQAPHGDMPNQTLINQAVMSMLRGDPVRLYEDVADVPVSHGLFSFDVPGAEETPEALAERLRTGQSGSNDLAQLRFAF